MTIRTALRRVQTVVLVLGLAPLLCAQVPAITNITIDNIGHTSLMVKYNISPDSYCQVRYGIASGQYSWASESLQSSAQGLSGNCWVPINGLNEGTTYYFLPTARPDPDDDNNICAAGACGSSEVSATTLTGAAPHLASLPTKVASWVSSYPDTSANYVTITLADGGPSLNHECVAASDVTAPPGYNWTIAAGTTFENVVTTVGFGTIIEVPEGLTCEVKGDANGNSRNHGYVWPDRPVDPLATGLDDPNHRWIIVRTQEANSGDLPPFGYRGGPQFSSNYGAFQASTPLPSDMLNFYTGGSIWQSAEDKYGLVHHIWISNLKFAVDETQSTAQWDVFMNFGTPYTNPQGYFPQYIVVERCWFHAPPRVGTNATLPYAAAALYGAPQAQFGFYGNYMDNFTWGGNEGIPMGIQMIDGTGGPLLYDNNYCDSMAMCFESETNYPTLTNWLHDWTFTHNTVYWPLSQLPFASYIKNNAAFGGAYACRNGFETKGVDKLLLAGNTFNGQWSCANSGMPILLALTFRDVTIRSNLIHRSAMVIGLNGQGNGTSTWGVRYPSTRVLVENNLAYDLGRALYGYLGPGLDGGYVEVATPTNDVTFRRNTFGPIAATNWWLIPQVAFVGYGEGTQANFRWESNLFHFGTGAHPYWGGIMDNFGIMGPGGIGSHQPAPIPYDLSPGTYGQYAATLAFNSSKADGVTGLGISSVTVNQSGSGYSNGAWVSFGGCSNPPAATIGVRESSIVQVNLTSPGSGCNPASLTATVSGGRGAVLTPMYAGSPSYFWGNNVGICTSAGLADMDAGTCAAATASMPGGDVFVTGGSTAERYASAGLLGISNQDYTCTPTAQSDCHAGVVMSRLESEVGVVSQISAMASASGVQISYVAPDARGCYVDLSVDGAHWMRQADGGGRRARNVAFVSGISPATAYQYRVLCYYAQDLENSPWFEFPADSSNLSTSGVVTTLPADVADLNVSFALDGATSYRVVLTGIDGTQYRNTCSTSPCVVTGVPVGDYSAVWQYLNGPAVVRTSAAQKVRVR